VQGAAGFFRVAVSLVGCCLSPGRPWAALQLLTPGVGNFHLSLNKRPQPTPTDFYPRPPPSSRACRSALPPTCCGGATSCAPRPTRRSSRRRVRVCWRVFVCVGVLCVFLMAILLLRTQPIINQPITTRPPQPPHKHPQKPPPSRACAPSWRAPTRWSRRWSASWRRPRRARPRRRTRCAARAWPLGPLGVQECWLSLQPLPNANHTLSHYIHSTPTHPMRTQTRPVQVCREGGRGALRRRQARGRRRRRRRGAARGAAGQGGRGEAARGRPEPVRALAPVAGLACCSVACVSFCCPPLLHVFYGTDLLPTNQSTNQPTARRIKDLGTLPSEAFEKYRGKSAKVGGS
jgi:hypothetical protein